VTTLSRPRPLRSGAAQAGGVAVALASLAVLGLVEVRTPPNITFGGLLLLVVLASTWLFSIPAAALVTLGAVSVPLIAWRAGGDDIVVAEVQVLAILVLSTTVQLALRAVERYAELLARRNRELLDVNASLERFTADAAHEFRAPLAVVLSEVDLALARGGEIADYRRHLEAIRDEVAGMRRSIAGLLTLARADAGSLEAAFRPIDLVDFLELSLARWRPLFAARDAGLGGALPDAGELVCDPDLLVRVIDNLLDNALRVLPAGGSAEVAARRDGDDWLLVVSDTGPGVEREAVAQLIGGPSLRPASRSRRTGGSGFGLALCAAIVRAHQGTIGVESGPGGSAFTVRLPARIA
jgi:signal transduction histidine kinase